MGKNLPNKEEKDQKTQGKNTEITTKQSLNNITELGEIHAQINHKDQQTALFSEKHYPMTLHEQKSHTQPTATYRLETKIRYNPYATRSNKQERDEKRSYLNKLWLHKNDKKPGHQDQMIRTPTQNDFSDNSQRQLKKMVEQGKLTPDDIYISNTPNLETYIILRPHRQHELLLPLETINNHLKANSNVQWQNTNTKC